MSRLAFVDWGQTMAETAVDEGCVVEVHFGPFGVEKAAEEMKIGDEFAVAVVGLPVRIRYVTVAGMARQCRIGLVVVEFVVGRLAADYRIDYQMWDSVPERAGAELPRAVDWTSDAMGFVDRVAVAAFAVEFVVAGMRVAHFGSAVDGLAGGTDARVVAVPFVGACVVAVGSGGDGDAFAAAVGDFGREVGAYATADGDDAAETGGDVDVSVDACVACVAVVVDLNSAAVVG